MADEVKSVPVPAPAPVAPEQKPGWQTSEFWIAVACLVFAGVLSIKGKDELAALLVGVAGSAYPASRAWVKGRAAAAVILLALAFGGMLVLGGRVARAADNESPGQLPATFANSAYRLDQQTAALRTAVTAADSTTLNAAYFSGATALRTNGRSTVSVSARTSVASATVTIKVVAAYRGPDNTFYLLGVSGNTTLTGHATITDTNSKFVANTAIFDSYGASHIFINVVTAPSSGNVDFWVGSY